MKRYALSVRCKSESCSAEPLAISNGAFVCYEDVLPLIEALRELNELVVFSNQKQIIARVLPLLETP